MSETIALQGWHGYRRDMESGKNRIHVFKDKTDAMKASLLLILQGYSYVPDRVIYSSAVDRIEEADITLDRDGIKIYCLKIVYHGIEKLFQVFLYDNLSAFIQSGNKIIPFDEVNKRIASIHQSFNDPNRRRPIQEYERELLRIYEALAEDYNSGKLHIAA